MAKTDIQWADVVLNCFRGCLKVSEGCKNCYAITTAHSLNTRFKGAKSVAARKVAAKYEGLTKVLSNGEKNWTGEVQVDYDTMMQPFKWKKGKRIFVNSMSDVFYEKISVADIAILWAVMFLTPQHTYMILTKRPKQMEAILSSEGFYNDLLYFVNKIAEYRFYRNPKQGGPVFPTLASWIIEYKKFENMLTIFNKTNYAVKGASVFHPDKEIRAAYPFKNIWLGVSVENQATANERIPLLLSTPAHIRFLSMEPLLGEVDLNNIKYGSNYAITALGKYENDLLRRELGILTSINWVIVGGESGSKARPMNPLWVQKIQQDCEKANVPFFFKQWGEWSPFTTALLKSGRNLKSYTFNDKLPDEITVYKAGKKLAGRGLKQGKEFNEFPKT